MGSYKWDYTFLIWAINIVTLLTTPLITTHEPPSRAAAMEESGRIPVLMDQTWTHQGFRRTVALGAGRP